jgi:hypothetical protein
MINLYDNIQNYLENPAKHKKKIKKNTVEDYQTKNTKKSIELRIKEMNGKLGEIENDKKKKY